MKTPGFSVREGYLVPDTIELAKSYGDVPSFLWARLKDAVRRAGRWDDFAQEARLAGDVGADAERALFARWVLELRLAVPAGHYPGQRLWPWTRGWTDRLADTYLAAPHLTVAPEPSP